MHSHASLIYQQFIALNHLLFSQFITTFHRKPTRVNFHYIKLEITEGFGFILMQASFVTKIPAHYGPKTNAPNHLQRKRAGKCSQLIKCN